MPLRLLECQRHSWLWTGYHQKIIKISNGGYLGIYHYSSTGNSRDFNVCSATSIDLLNWKFHRIIKHEASQPTIVQAPRYLCLTLYGREGKSKRKPWKVLDLETFEALKRIAPEGEGDVKKLIEEAIRRLLKA